MNPAELPDLRERRRKNAIQANETCAVMFTGVHR